jgi:hypothetical protein
MKKFSPLPEPGPASRRFVGRALAVCAFFHCATLLLHGQLFQSDNFNDGNDSGWARYDALAPLGMNATYGFPSGGYRIQTTYLGGSAQLTGRSGSVRPEIYTDFYVAVDIVNWDDTLPQSFGLLARVGTPGLGTTTGYAFTWDRGNPTNATAGDLDISKITGEAPSNVDTGPSGIRLEPGRKYRMVFIGRGAALEGRLYETTDLVNPLLVIQGSDSTYTSGQNGLVVFDNSAGRSRTDATFDNFYATDIEPPRLRTTSFGFGAYELWWPREAVAYELQSSIVFPGTEQDWQTVTGVLTSEDRFWIFLDTDPLLGGLPQQYFRLVRK